MAKILYIEDYEDNFTFVKRFLVPRGLNCFGRKTPNRGWRWPFR